MGVFQKQGAWWIDWYDGRRRLRKKARAVTRAEAMKLLEKIKARMLPRDLGLFDPKLKCAEFVTRHLGAVIATPSDIHGIIWAEMDEAVVRLLFESCACMLIVGK